MPDLKRLHLEQLKKSLMNALNMEAPRTLIDPASFEDISPEWFRHFWFGNALTMCGMQKLNNRNPASSRVYGSTSRGTSWSAASGEAGQRSSCAVCWLPTQSVIAPSGSPIPSKGYPGSARETDRRAARGCRLI